MDLLIYYKQAVRKPRETILSPFREEKSSVYHYLSLVANREFEFVDEKSKKEYLSLYDIRLWTFDLVH